MTKAKIKSKSSKKDSERFRKVQKGSERIQEVINRIRVAVPSSVDDALNAI